MLARYGFVLARNCLCRRIGKASLYSWQLCDILNGILESDGYERRINDIINKFLKRYEGTLNVNTQTSLCFEICSNIILNEDGNLMLLDAFYSYYLSKNIETRYENENIIREVIKNCIQNVYNEREKIYMVEDHDEYHDDTSFLRNSCFLESFLTNTNKISIEDNTTVLFQFLINQILIPLVESMKTMTDLLHHNRNSIEHLYKKYMKLKSVPRNETLSFSSSSIFSWVNECHQSLLNHEEEYQSKQIKEKEERKDSDKELTSTSTIGIRKGMKNELVDHVSQYKLAVRRLVYESKQKQVNKSQTTIYYRTDINNNDDSTIPKDCIVLTFPKDIMMNDKFNSIFERSIFFDVVLCNFIHQMISGYNFVGGSEYVDQSKNN